MLVLSAGTSPRAVSWKKCLSIFLPKSNSLFFFFSFLPSLFSTLQKIPGKFKKLFTELESLTVSMVLTADEHCLLYLPSFFLIYLKSACYCLELDLSCQIHDLLKAMWLSRAPRWSANMKRKEAVFLTEGGRAERAKWSISSPASIWELFFCSGS